MEGLRWDGVSHGQSDTTTNRVTHDVSVWSCPRHERPTTYDRRPNSDRGKSPRDLPRGRRTKSPSTVYAFVRGYPFVKVLLLIKKGFLNFKKG